MRPRSLSAAFAASVMLATVAPTPLQAGAELMLIDQLNSLTEQDEKDSREFWNSLSPEAIKKGVQIFLAVTAILATVAICARPSPPRPGP